MVRPPFRPLLDAIFATVSPDGEALRVGSDDAVDRAARRALGELAHCVVSATRFGVSGPGRAVGERFAALTSAVVEDAGGASLSRDERDGLAGLAIVGILCAIDGPSGYLRYIRRFGTVSRFLHHGMLADAEAMVAERDAVAASVRGGPPSARLPGGGDATPPPAASLSLASSLLVPAGPGGADASGEAGWRHAPLLHVRGHPVPSVWLEGGERLYHGRHAVAALGYAAPRDALTDIARLDPSAVAYLSYRDQGSTLQRRRVRFLTPQGFLLALMRVRPSMPGFAHARGMLLAVVGRLTSSSAIDLEGLDRRHAAAAATFLRANALSRRRIVRLDALVRDYEAEVRAVASDVEHARMGEASRRRGFDLLVASLREEAAELRVTVDLLRDENEGLRAQVAELMALRERDHRERHGLDPGRSRSTGPRGRPRGPLN